MLKPPPSGRNQRLDDHEHIAPQTYWSLRIYIANPCERILLPHYQPIRELCTSWSHSLGCSSLIWLLKMLSWNQWGVWIFLDSWSSSLAPCNKYCTFSPWPSVSRLASLHVGKPTQYYPYPFSLGLCLTHVVFHTRGQDSEFLRPEAYIVKLFIYIYIYIYIYIKHRFIHSPNFPKGLHSWLSG